MNRILCGKCALKSKMSLEDRKGLAMSFDFETVYICADCKIYMLYDGLRWFKTHDWILVQSVADYHLNKRKGVLK